MTKKRYRFISIILIFSLVFMNFVSTTRVLAYGPIAYGEIKASGDVLIGSSTGKWTELKGVYPLLKNNNLMTREGTVLIAMKEGSKVELSKNTEASIDVENPNYSVNLKTGTLFFGVIPSDSLSVITAQAAISVAKSPNFHDFTSSAQGVVLSSEKGTEVRCISGDIKVSYLDSQEKILKTGENLFVSATGSDAMQEGEAKGESAGVYATGAKASLIKYIILGGVVIAGGTVVALTAFRGGGEGGKKVASPSAPPF